MAILLTPSILGGTYMDSVEVTLTCDNPLATIQYTLNGESPLCPNASAYSGETITLSTQTEDVDIVFKAIAYTDSEISNLVSESFSIVHSGADSDNDGITNSVEGITEDTDADGILNYLDVDSDADGLPDSIEGTGDYDQDGVPNYIDPDQVEDFIYEFIGMPISEMVENVPYEFQLKVLNGSADMYINDSEEVLLGLDATVGDPIRVNVGDIVNFTVMPSVCRSVDLTTLTFTFVEIPSENNIVSSFPISIVKSNDDFPIEGIHISWKKNSLARTYRIYKKTPLQQELSLLVEVPHDPTTASIYQWYIDRSGNVSDRYSVSAVDDDGIEGDLSLPKHAPDVAANMCLLQGNIADIGMTPLEGVCIACRIKEAPSRVSNTFLQKGSSLYYTDARGYFEVILPQGSVITLSIDSVGFKKDLIVPYLSSINIDELLLLPQNSM